MTVDKARHGELPPLQREAIAWLARMTSGMATAEDAEDLRKWRALSPAHDDAFRTASLIWRETARALATDGAAPSLKRRGFLKVGAIVTGGAVAAGAAGIWLGVLPSIPNMLADYHAPIGEQRRISLADGSMMELDADSAVDVDFTAGNRSLELLQGSAYFNVAKDERAFRVASGAGSAIAAEAAFAISAIGDETLVECLDGHITVACGDTVELQKGQRVTYSGSSLSAPQTVEPDAAAPWLRGLLIFADRTLTSVVADLNRHRKGKIIVMNASAGDRRVSGVFHLNRPDEIISHLVNSLRLERVDLPGGIIILS